MTTPINTLTYDQGTPHRPAVPDLQFATKVNDAVYPPDDAQAPFAEEANQQALQVAATGRVTPLAVIDINFSAGTPSVFRQTSVKTVEPVYVIGDVGNGNTTITWPAGTFPTALYRPVACPTQDLEVNICAFPITNGVQVRTRLAGVGTDCNYTVIIG